MRRVLPSVIVPALLGLCGCDAGTWLGFDEPRHPLHASLPTVVNYGGPVLTAPKVVPIFFDGDPMTGDVERFLGELAKSSYWGVTTHEYGVGRLRIGPSIVVPESAPTSMETAELEAWLAEHLDGTHPEWPALDAETIHVVFFPSYTVLFSKKNGSRRCTDFTGYHDEGFLGAAHAESADAGAFVGGDARVGPSFVYAAIVECSDAGDLTGLDVVTDAVSHELVEAATNPFDRSNPAYAEVSTDYLAWVAAFDGTNTTLDYGELADLCEYEEGKSSTRHAHLPDGSAVARSWSNANASAGLDPCVPDSEAYFNAAPDFPTMKTTLGTEDTYTTTGIDVPLHSSKTVDVRLFTSGAVKDWHMSAFTRVTDQNADPVLRFGWDRDTGNDGAFLRLTLTRVHAGPVDGTPIWIQSSSKADGSGIVHRWAGLVGN